MDHLHSLFHLHSFVTTLTLWYHSATTPALNFKSHSTCICNFSTEGPIHDDTHWYQCHAELFIQCAEIFIHQYTSKPSLIFALRLNTRFWIGRPSNLQTEIQHINSSNTETFNTVHTEMLQCSNRLTTPEKASPALFMSS